MTIDNETEPARGDAVPLVGALDTADTLDASVRRAIEAYPAEPTLAACDRVMLDRKYLRGNLRATVEALGLRPSATLDDVLRAIADLRRPIPADHHEPARGDAVPVDGDNTWSWSRGYAAAITGVRAALNGEQQGPLPPEAGVVVDRVEGLRRNWLAVSAQRDEAMGTAASIATALGMDPGALDGAIVERVESLVAGLDDAREQLCERKAQRDEAREERDAHRADAERLQRERDEAERDAQRFVDAIGDAAIAAGVGDALTDGQPHTADEIAIARVGAMGAEVERLTERLGYYERGHYDGLLADLRRRLEATEAKR